jgi:hypothetical protein
MGDNVLYEDEVAAAMDAALQNGLDVTATRTGGDSSARR